MPRRRTLIPGAATGLGCAVAAAGVRGPPASALEAVFRTASPTVTGPIRGGRHGWPFGAFYGDIGALGYVEEEYFIAGQALRFAPVGALRQDGRWSVEPTTPAPYKTRILVRRPTNPKAFNGTVIVEWTNVSAGYDLALCDPLGVYDGFAYVAVAAQRVGVHGYPIKPQGLIDWDPERYGSLSIPDDALSYDIYTQAARLVAPRREVHGVDPLGGLKVRKLIAVGASQSGVRLLAYINGIQRRERVFDAIMPIICAGRASDFNPAPAMPDPNGPNGGGNSRSVRTIVRTDLATPVLALNTETEALYYCPLRQPDTPRFIYWEIAGASHAAPALSSTFQQTTARDGVGPAGFQENPRVSDVSWLPTADAAIQHLHRWLNGGRPPPRQQPMVISGEPPAIARDKYGNALGGIRLPELEAPIARYTFSGALNDYFGKRQAFPAAELKALYPTHARYVEEVLTAATAAKRDGFIPPYRVKEYVKAAQDAAIPA
jgi:Alpha/beta hydrolase domain